MMRITIPIRELRDILLVLGGVTLLGLSYALFLIPYRIVPGGVGGLSIILNHFLRTPVGLVMILLNIPIFAMGIKVLGVGFGAKSVLGMVASAFSIDLFTYILRFPIPTQNPILAAIYGGILLGTGLGMAFRGKGSTGGIDIIGRLINHYSNISTGMGILGVDLLIISLAGISFRSAELALYGYLVLYLSSRVIDLVIEGWGYARAVLIVSRRGDEISEVILKKLNRGVTRIPAQGVYTQAGVDLLLSVVTNREIPEMRRFIREVDPEAFVIIADVYEVLGRGFRPRV